MRFCSEETLWGILQDNYPQMDTTLLDLSPYYLQEARRNVRYWADKRAPGEILGGPDGTGTTYVQAPAEAISQPDSSYDVVCEHPCTCNSYFGAVTCLKALLRTLLRARQY